MGGSAYGVVTGKSGAGLVAGSRMGFNMFAFGFPFFGESAMRICRGEAWRGVPEAEADKMVDTQRFESMH